MNYLCPYCKEDYLEPMWFVDDIYIMHGEFVCNMCNKVSFVIDVPEETYYAYPFENEIKYNRSRV